MKGASLCREAGRGRQAFPEGRRSWPNGRQGSAVRAGVAREKARGGAGPRWGLIDPVSSVHLEIVGGRGT